MMNVDPARLGYRQYLALLGEWNLRHSEDGAPKPEADFTDVKRAMKARSLH